MEVGDKLICVPDQRSRHGRPEQYEIEISRVGRKYIYIDPYNNGGEKCLEPTSVGQWKEKETYTYYYTTYYYTQEKLKQIQAYQELDELSKPIKTTIGDGIHSGTNIKKMKEEMLAAIAKIDEILGESDANVQKMLASIRSNDNCCNVRVVSPN